MHASSAPRGLSLRVFTVSGGPDGTVATARDHALAGLQVSLKAGRGVVAGTKSRTVASFLRCAQPVFLAAVSGVDLPRQPPSR